MLKDTRTFCLRAAERFEAMTIKGRVTGTVREVRGRTILADLDPEFGEVEYDGLQIARVRRI